MSLPLDKIEIQLEHSKGKRETIPALHPSWQEDVQFVSYQPPPMDKDDHGLYEEWLDRLKFITEDLHWLLKLPHDKFWCQAIFDESLHGLIDTYLRFAPRTYDVICELPDDGQERHNEVHRLIFMTCLRMATYKESKEYHITPHVFGEILYENFLFDIPKIFDLCVLYGQGNGALLGKMIENIFTQQSRYNDDLRNTIPTILQVFESIQQKCGLLHPSGSSSPQKLSSPKKENSLLSTMATPDFQDVVFYMADTGITLSSFLEVYPPATDVFLKENFVNSLAVFYDVMVPEILAAIKTREFENHSHKQLLKQKMNQAKKSLLKIVHLIITHCCIQPLLEHSEKQEECIEEFIQVFSGILNERRFLSDFESCHTFQDYSDILMQTECDIDDTRMHYIQDAINSAFATYGKRRKPTGATNRGGRTSPDGSPGPLEEGAIGGAGCGAASNSGNSDASFHGDDKTEDSKQEAGACAPRISGIELESMITSVKDLLPDLGDGFIELCLEELGYNIETVINAMLEDKLPASLANLNRDMPRKKKPLPEESESVLSERVNVYDNDEFDVFSRDSVDTSRIHKGKQKKTDNLTLDNKGMEDGIKSQLSLKYGYQVVEFDSDAVGGGEVNQMYEDEYDDTYDDNNVGADDADSADELTFRRPFTVPRVLGFLAQKEDKEAEQSSSESEDSDEKPNRDEFIQNPALLRQKAEERAQAKRQGHRYGHNQPHNQPQGDKDDQKQGQGDRKYDVKGKAKGQGQDADVLRNRRWKEKHKSFGGNHNRRYMADKKRMGAPPK